MQHICLRVNLEHYSCTNTFHKIRIAWSHLNSMETVSVSSWKGDTHRKSILVDVSTKFTYAVLSSCSRIRVLSVQYYSPTLWLIATFPLFSTHPRTDLNSLGFTIAVGFIFVLIVLIWSCKCFLHETQYKTANRSAQKGVERSWYLIEDTLFRDNLEWRHSDRLGSFRRCTANVIDSAETRSTINGWGEVNDAILWLDSWV